jgi:hypothetical protein
MRLNLTTLFIDTMAWLGLADQRKKMSPEAVERRKERTGDGTMDFFHKQSLVGEAVVSRKVSEVTTTECSGSAEN